MYIWKGISVLKLLMQICVNTSSYPEGCRFSHEQLIIIRIIAHLIIAVTIQYDNVVNNAVK